MPDPGVFQQNQQNLDLIITSKFPIIYYLGLGTHCSKVATTQLNSVVKLKDYIK